MSISKFEFFIIKKTAVSFQKSNRILLIKYFLCIDIILKQFFLIININT